jgi:hypothetical protein
MPKRCSSCWLIDQSATNGTENQKGSTSYMKAQGLPQETMMPKNALR